MIEHGQNGSEAAAPAQAARAGAVPRAVHQANGGPLASAAGAASDKSLGLPNWFWVVAAGAGLYMLARARADAAHALDLEELQIEGTATTRPDNPPSWVMDETTWTRAKEQVRPYWDAYSEPWAVVAHVYRQMGGATTGAAA